MYAIVVYDAGTHERSDIRAVLKKQLHWIQNSVFAGEVTRTAANDLFGALSEVAESARITFWLLDRKPETRILGEQDDQEAIFL